MLGASFKRFFRIMRNARSERTDYEDRRAELLARAKMLEEAKKDYDEARQTYRDLQQAAGSGGTRSMDQNRDTS